METPDKGALDLLMKEVSPSSIPIHKLAAEVASISPDRNAMNQNSWGNKSNKLLNDYRYGEGLARYGENDPTTKVFFKRFASSFCAIITNEHQKRGLSTEDMKPLYTILESTMLLLAKEIDKKDLKDFEILAIIASLQGFVTNYNQQKEIR